MQLFKATLLRQEQSQDLRQAEQTEEGKRLVEQQRNMDPILLG